MKAQQRRRAVANEAMVCKCKGGVFISSEEVREGQWFPCNHDDACDGMMYGGFVTVDVQGQGVILWSTYSYQSGSLSR
jgi:hypothetical protein